MKRYTLFLLGLAALLQPVLADSFYSSVGLGMPKYFVSPKASGMGGAGIGVSEFMTMNVMNPAANDIRYATCLGVQFEFELINNSSTISEVSTRNGNAAGMQFMFPLKTNVAFISYLRPLTVSRYILEATQSEGQVPYTQTITGNGGLSTAGLGLQYIYKERISIASVINFNFGSVNESWNLSFSSDEYVDAADKFNSHFSGASVDLGLLVKPVNKLSLGLVYKGSADLLQRTDIIYGSGYTFKQEDGHIIYPQAWGGGMSLALNKLTLALDYFHQQWSRYEVNGRTRDDFKDFNRLSAGVEYLRSSKTTDRYSHRVSWRLGGYLATLPVVGANGDALTEKVLTFGTTLPFMMNNGRIDLGFELGVRGNQSQFLYREAIYRFTAGVAGGERWFMRR